MGQTYGLVRQNTCRNKCRGNVGVFARVLLTAHVLGDARHSEDRSLPRAATGRHRCGGPCGLP